MALRNLFENVSTESKQQEIIDRLADGTQIAKIRDGENHELEINPDGSINTNSEISIGGNEVSASNPLPIEGTVTTTGAELVIDKVLDDSGYQLQGTSYNKTTQGTTDFILTGLDLKFSSPAPRDITLTTVGGVVVYKSENNTSLSVFIDGEEEAFDSSEQLNLQISATGISCEVDVSLKVKRGALSLSGDPLVGVKGIDGFNQASVNNPFPVSTGNVYERIDTRQPLVNGSQVSFQVSPVNDTIVVSAHGLSDNNRVVFSVEEGSTLPSGILADTIYYVTVVDTGSFKISLFEGAPFVDITDTGSGAFTYQLRGSFTSDWIDLQQNPDFYFVYLSDQDASVFLDYSDDGITPANTGSFFSDREALETTNEEGIFFTQRRPQQPPFRRYIRFNITNGTVNQLFQETVFFKLRDSYQGTFAGLDSPLSIIQSFLLTRSVNVGTTFSGEFKNAQLEEHSFDPANNQVAPLTNGVETSFTATAGTITPNTGLVDGDRVDVFNSSIDSQVVYFVVNATENNFQVSATEGGAPIEFDTTGGETFRQRGQFLGTFSDGSQAGHLLFFYITNNNPTVTIEFSDDGISQTSGIINALPVNLNELDGGPLGTLSVAVAPITTFIRPFYRVRVVNDLTDQFPGITEGQVLIGKGAYTGTFGGLNDDLTNISTALLSRSVLSAFREDGTFGNIRSTNLDSLKVSIENSTLSTAGSLFAEGIRDDISLDYTDALTVDEANDEGVFNQSTNNATITHNISAGTIYQTTAEPNSVAQATSRKKAGFEPGHMVIGEQSIRLESLPTGDAVIEWGFFDGNTGLLWRVDATGLKVVWKQNGMDGLSVSQELFNRDVLQGQQLSSFKTTEGPVPIDVTKGNVFRIQYGSSPDIIEFKVKSPNGSVVTAHAIEFPNSADFPSFQTNNLPLYLRVDNGTSGQSLRVDTIAWRGGIVTSKATLTGKNPDGDFVEASFQGRHSTNSTMDALPGDTGLGDNVYRGRWFEWQNKYVGLSVDAIADAKGQLIIELSQSENPTNGIDDDVTSIIGPVFYDPAQTDLLSRTYPLQSRWVRVKWVNGVDPQTEFALSTTFLASSPAIPLQPLFDLPNTTSVGPTNNSILLVKEEGEQAFHQVESTENQFNKKGVNVHITGQDGDGIFVRDNVSERAIADRKVVGAFSPIQLDTTKLQNRKKVRVRAIVPPPLAGVEQTVTEQFIAVGFSPDITFRSGSEIISSLDPHVEYTLDEGVDLYAITFDNGQGSRTESEIQPVLPPLGEATDVGNAVDSDDQYAVIDNNNDDITYQPGSFTDPATGEEQVESIVFNMEANKDISTLQSVEFQGVNTAQAGDVTQIAVADVPADASALYILTVAWHDPTQAVNGVNSTLGFTNFEAIADSGATASDEARVLTGVLRGTPNQDGTVGVTFTGAVDSATISVTRYTGHDPVNTIGGSATTGSTGDVDNYSLQVPATLRGRLVTVGGMELQNHNEAAGFVERAEFGTDANDQTEQFVADAPVTTDGQNTISGSYTSADNADSDWAVVGFSINPASPADPQVRIDITYQGEIVFTELRRIDTSVDSIFSFDFTNARQWIAADVPQIQVAITGTDIDPQLPARVDASTITLTEVSGPRSFVSVYQEA